MQRTARGEGWLNCHGEDKMGSQLHGPLLQLVHQEYAECNLLAPQLVAQGLWCTGLCFKAETNGTLPSFRDVGATRGCHHHHHQA